MTGTPLGRSAINASTLEAPSTVPLSTEDTCGGLPAPLEPARPPQGPASVKHVFRRTSVLSEEEGAGAAAQTPPHRDDGAAPPARQQGVAERVAALPQAQLQRWLSNAVR